MYLCINRYSYLNYVQGILDSAFVFCRHGGSDSFDVQFVHEVVYIMLSIYTKKQLEFIFLNTNSFGPDNERIHMLPTNTNMIYKEKFIASCDAMIHARSIGMCSYIII